MPRRPRLLPIGLAVVIALGLLWLAASRTVRPLREAASRPFLSIARSLHAAGVGAAGLFGRGAAARIRELENERIRLLAEIAKGEALRKENELLRSVLALRRRGEEAAIPATAVAFLREGREEFLVLDRGTSDGIGIGDLVIDHRGALGGTVISVAPRSSRVILLTSASRSIDVVIPAAHDLRAIAKGNNGGELTVELVPQGTTLAIGDIILASPRSTGGRGGLLIGEVRDAGEAEQEVFKSVRALHLFDPATEGVIVLLAPE